MYEKIFCRPTSADPYFFRQNENFLIMKQSRTAFKEILVNSIHFYAQLTLDQKNKDAKNFNIKLETRNFFGIS